MRKKVSGKRCARTARLLRGCIVVAGLRSGMDAPARGLTINLTYDSTVAGLSYAASVESATNYAAQQIESLFNDNMTPNINVAASANAFGQSGYSYVHVRRRCGFDGQHQRR